MSIRSGGAGGDSTELMEEWFRLVQEKNHLLRKENDLMIQQRELQLQVMDISQITSDLPESSSNQYWIWNSVSVGGNFKTHFWWSFGATVKSLQKDANELKLWAIFWVVLIDQKKFYSSIKKIDQKKFYSSIKKLIRKSFIHQ